MAAFHSTHRGMTGDLLDKAVDQGARNPYDWALEPLEGEIDELRVLDLACGSSPLLARLSGNSIGIDRSSEELQLVAAKCEGRAIQADGRSLPLQQSSLDAVICTMALMLIDPAIDVMRELRRVLKPAGKVIVLLPHSSALGRVDRLKWSALHVAARTQPLAWPVEPSSIPEAVQRGGLTVIHDSTNEFVVALNDRTTRSTFVRSLYLADTRLRAYNRADAAAAILGRKIALPLRRIVATR